MKRKYQVISPVSRFANDHFNQLILVRLWPIIPMGLWYNILFVASLKKTKVERDVSEITKGLAEQPMTW